MRVPLYRAADVDALADIPGVNVRIVRLRRTLAATRDAEHDGPAAAEWRQAGGARTSAQPLVPVAQ